jgi:MFS family permease
MMEQRTHIMHLSHLYASNTGLGWDAERLLAICANVIIARRLSLHRAYLLGPVLLLALLPSNVVSAAMPLLLKEWQAPNIEGGIVFAAYQVGYVISVLLVLPLTDRIRAGRLITACALATSLSFILFPLLAVNVWTASLLRFFAGLGLAGIYLPGVRIIAASASPLRRGLVVGGYVSAFYLGSAVSLWATGVLLPAYGWRGAALALALAACLAVPLALTATRGMGSPAGSREPAGGSSSPSARASARSSGEAAEGIDFRTPSFGPSGEVGLTADPKGLSARGGAAAVPVAGSHGPVGASGRLDLSVLRQGPVARNVLAYTGHSWELYVSRGWLAAFVASVLVAQGRDALSASAAGSQWAALMLGFGTPGVLLGGWLSDHLGRARTALLITLSSGALSLVFGFLGAGPWSLLLAAGCLYGLLISADSAIYSTAITEIASPARLGSAQAVQAFVGFSATIIAPIAAGKALDLGWGWGAIFVLAGVVGLAMGAPLLRGDRQKNSSPNP